jgi:hypothetical protein
MDFLDAIFELCCEEKKRKGVEKEAKRSRGCQAGDAKPGMPSREDVDKEASHI